MIGFKLPGWAWASIAGTALIVLLGLGGWGLHRSGYNQGRSDCEAAHTLEALQGFKRETDRLADVSNSLAVQIDSLASAAPTVIKEYHETVVKTPLPAGCVIDPDRLRSIQSAIGAATAAGKRGAAVPTGTGVR